MCTARFVSLPLTLGALVCVAIRAEGQDTRRNWHAVPRQVAVIEDRDGTLFGDPLRIKASPDGGFVVADWGELTIRAFSADGEPVWRFGQQGAGPGEFFMFSDIEYGTDGELLILDDKNARLTILSPDGGLVRTVRTPVGRMSQVLPATASRQWLLMPTEDRRRTFCLLVSESGRGTKSVSWPPQLSFSHDMAAEAFAAPTGNGRAVVVFRWASPLVFVEADGTVAAVVEGVERIPFPDVVDYNVDTKASGLDRQGIKNMRMTKIDPQAVLAVKSVTADRSHVFVLLAGGSEDRERIVDTYSVLDGAYRGSFLLPRPVADIAVLADGRLATLEREFFPTVRLWTVSGG